MPTETNYDVIVVGAGLAGLQAGISFSADGVPVLVVDKRTIGGQAGESALIENMIGFSHGVTGRQLADSGIILMKRFGGEILVPYEVQRIIPCDDGTFIVVGEDRSRMTCKAVVLAVGVQYRRLEAQNINDYIHRGVEYGSPLKEPGRWTGKRVGVIGGANSAAQAAFYLADKCGCTVEMFVRGPTIDHQMSTYMAEDISRLPNITVHLNSEVQEVFGDAERFQGVVLKKNGTLERLQLDYMNILIGALPHTAWVEDLVTLDKHGFILTDRDLPEGAWRNSLRAPHAYETSVPGIFAVGDVEALSVKRASAAIGNGSSCTSSVRRHIAELNERHRAVQTKA